MGHARTPDGRMNMVWSAFDLVGSGGLHTTVNDMLKWNANFEKPRLPGGSALMRRYLDPGVDVGKRARDLGEGPDHPTRYGFGLVHTSYRGIEVIQHSGQSFGYRAHFMRLPKQRFAAVALCNLLEIDPVALLRQVVDIHVPEASAPVGEPPEPFTPTVREPSYEPEPQQLARFEGSYYSRELDSVFRLRRTDRGLELRRHYSEPDLLVAVGPREFELPLLGGIVWASLRFLPGDRRELDELTLEMDRFGMIRLSRTE